MIDHTHQPVYLICPCPSSSTRACSTRVAFLRSQSLPLELVAPAAVGVCNVCSIPAPFTLLLVLYSCVHTDCARETCFDSGDCRARLGRDYVFPHLIVRILLANRTPQLDWDVDRPFDSVDSYSPLAAIRCRRLSGHVYQMPIASVFYAPGCADRDRTIVHNHVVQLLYASDVTFRRAVQWTTTSSGHLSSAD
jgi:hypothetical protein